MAKPVKEATVRTLMKELWGKRPPNLTWIEPRSGSTQGAPDLLVPVGDALVAMELKVGRIVRKGSVEFIDVNVRPAQWAWHHDQYSGGVRTFFLVALGYREFILCSPMWLAWAVTEYKEPKVLNNQAIGRAHMKEWLDYVTKNKALLVRSNR